MEKYVSTQIAKEAMKTKGGDRVLLAVEHRFDEYYKPEFATTAGTLETSGLDRFVFRINKKPQKGETISVKANIPATDVMGIYALSEEVFKNISLNAFSAPGTEQKIIKSVESVLEKTKASDDFKNKLADDIAKTVLSNLSGDEVVIYAPADKYFRAKNDKEEYLCYSIKITCRPQNRMPIQITIKNYWAPVRFLPDGTTQIEISKAHDDQTAMIWLQLSKWFSLISHIKDLWAEYQTASFSSRFKRSLIAK